eukprot:CAMPEP_0172626526 /NCGR_PEP_ID=MMETSP1068-20121228/150747_1 /TAXON_ID=35684 /ORGANISM="Pseudopedinella elastica, Strain CCMP716" /LENGTH=367 /DNA_ID=CAMNT_0013436159 /DNA_START=184 /DNA_END=1287 /DNA_ORIENTATION=+
MAMTQQAPQAFEYASQPQAVGTKRRAKYRGDDESQGDDSLGLNIHTDRRVVRGNTYAAQVVTQNAARELDRLRMENERAIKRDVARKRMEASARPKTPPPVPGRSHADTMTDTYLEELSDRPVEVDRDTQTEAYLDRPPSPLFVPAKSGQDAASQVDVAEIFDFNAEVAPILEVLVGKTLQTSMLEVMEEEELAAIRRRQDEFEEERNAELMEVQRLEAEAARKFAEKKRRVHQEKERKRLQAELKEKVAARSFAKAYLAEMNASVYGELEKEGAFYDPVKKEVEEVFLPWLFDAAVAQSTQTTVAQNLADDLLLSALGQAVKLHEAAKAKQAQLEAELEAKRKQEELEATLKAEEEKAAAPEGGEE